MSKGAGAQVPLRALERAIRKAGSAKAWATQAGVSEAYVSDVRLGRRDPGPAVLDALGLERVVQYRAAVAIPASVGIPLTQIGESACRYIADDPPAGPVTCCGHPSMSGWVWCAWHHAICTVRTSRPVSLWQPANRRAA